MICTYMMRKWQKIFSLIAICTSAGLFIRIIEHTQIHEAVYHPGVTLNTFEDITFINNQSHICKDEKDRDMLLVVVSTQSSKREVRSYVRLTWGSIKRYRSMTIKVVFFVGLTFSTTDDYNLYSESKLYRDIVIINQKETFYHLTEKSVTMLRWATEFCSKARFILKTEDHYFNNLPKYVDFLSLSLLPVEFVGGNCIYDWNLVRLVRYQLFTFKEPYLNDYYPEYCVGAAYIISMQAAMNIINISKHVVYEFSEDLFITGYCRQSARIATISMSGILPTHVSLTSCEFLVKVLTMNDIHPSKWQYIWGMIEPQVGMCCDT